MPLLFETGSHKYTRPRVLVAADPDEQVGRALRRVLLRTPLLGSGAPAQFPCIRHGPRLALTTPPSHWASSASHLKAVRPCASITTAAAPADGAGRELRGRRACEGGGPDAAGFKDAAGGHRGGQQWAAGGAGAAGAGESATRAHLRLDAADSSSPQCFTDDPCAVVTTQVSDLAVRLRRRALVSGLLTSPYALVLGAAAVRAWGPQLLAMLLRGLR